MQKNKQPNHDSKGWDVIIRPTVTGLAASHHETRREAIKACGELNCSFTGAFGHRSKVFSAEVVSCTGSCPKMVSPYKPTRNRTYD